MGSHRIMKRVFWITVTSMLVVASAGRYVQAREETGQATTYEQGKGTWQQPRQTGQLMLQSTLALMGGDVKSSRIPGTAEETGTPSEEPALARGETLGKVKDVVFDNDIDAVYCVLVSARDKYYPVPWEAFDTASTGTMLEGGMSEEGAGTSTYGATETEKARSRWGWRRREKGALCLNLSKEQFEQAPSIESVDMAALGDRALRQRVTDYYSAQGLIQQTGRGILRRMYSLRPQANLVKASDVIDMEVEDYAGREIAEIEDCIIDLHHGSLAYALVDFGGYWGLAKKTAAVPWSALSLDMDDEVAMLDATMETLDAAVIEKDDLSRLEDRAFARQIHQTFEAEPYWEVFAFVPAGTAAEWTAPWGADSAYNANFNTATMTTIEGTIRTVGSFRPQPNSALGLRLKVKPEDGKAVVVYAGPRLYAIRQGIDFKTGEQITVTGSKTQVNGKSVIMASELTTAGKTLQLRDAEGKPVWKLGSLQGTEGM